jgi:hypothetical protein
MGSGSRYVDDLAPEQLRRAYQHLDPFSAGAVLARGNAADDPYYFAPSHLAPEEHARAGYAERAAARGVQRATDTETDAGSLPPGAENLPPAESLPTLPFP